MANIGHIIYFRLICLRNINRGLVDSKSYNLADKVVSYYKNISSSSKVVDLCRATQIQVEMIFKCWQRNDEILLEIVRDVTKIESDGLRYLTRRELGGATAVTRQLHLPSVNFQVCSLL